jgi:predicted nucleotidyltransferase
MSDDLPMDRESIIKCLRQNLEYLRQNFYIRRLALFGSFARGNANLFSDVDLVVEFDRPIGLRFVELCDYLEECLGRRVDVLTLTGVQHIRNPNVSRSILESLVYV